MAISLFAILITTISSIFWGGFDGVRKHLTQKLNHWTLLFYLSFFFSLAFLIWILLNSSFKFSSEYITYGLVTVILNFFANYFYIKAIDLSDISSAVPYLAFTSLFTALSSYLILGEELKLFQVVGVLIVVIASFFINYKRNGHLLNSLKANQGALLMILVSLLWAISAPFDKLAVNYSNVVTHSFLQSIVISILNITMVLKFSKSRFISDLFVAPRVLIGGSIIAALALGLQFYAYTLMQVSIFESLKRSIAIITAFILSAIYFKEEISIIKISATAVILFGVFLILNGN